MKQILLLSTSKSHGEEYFQVAAPWITANFQGVKRILFVPYALAKQDKYAAVVGAALKKFGFETLSAHTSSYPVELLDKVEGIYVGGGNTFRLLKKLYETGLIAAIRQKVDAGMPYMGSSAGTNVACPTIKTTNDMPIVLPPSLDAMHLIPFQINPHYFDPDPDIMQRGETREERLLQFLEENTTPVIGLREGSAIHVMGDNITLLGAHTARLFQRQRLPVEIPPSDDNLLVLMGA